MVFSILPTFLTEELGATKTQIGLIEGVCIFVAFAAKVFAGILSDFLRKRKPLIIVGSVLTVLVKGLFATAFSVGWIFVARFVGRVAKGLRSAPTDALIADWSPEGKRATYFGLRQALYTGGAVVGALLAVGLMVLTDNNYRLIFWLSSVFAVIALVILIVNVQPAPITQQEARVEGELSKRWSLSHLKDFPMRYWLTLFVVGVIISARFSEVFLSLRLREMGWAIAMLPMMVVIMDIVHAGCAYPTGKLADERNRYKMLILALWVLILADAILAGGTGFVSSLLGIILIGLHMGISQGLIKALVCASIPFELRGTAFSLFNLVSGFAIFIGNACAGWLSDAYGLSQAFVFQGGLTLLGLLLIYSLGLQKKPALGH